MMDPAGAEAALNNFKPASFPEDDIRRWDTDILKGNVAMSVWRVIVSIHR
jgi:hypothetical protein